MMPGRVALTLMILAGLSAFAEKASSQAATAVEEIPDVFYKCSSWPIVAGYEKGKKLPLFLYWMGLENDPYNPGKERRGTAWVRGADGGYVQAEGTFVFRDPIVVGLFRPSDDPNVGADFIAPFRHSVDFYPDPRSAYPIPAPMGRFRSVYRRTADGRDDFWFRRIECVRGDSDDHLEEVDNFDKGILGKLSRGRLPPADWALEDKSDKSLADVARPPGGIPEAKTLDRLFKETIPAAKAPSGPSITSIPGMRPGIDSPPPATPKPGAISPGMPMDIRKSDGLKEAMAAPAKDATAGVKETAVPPGLVCDVATGNPLDVPKDVKLASLQTVGARSASTSAKAFDYILIGDAVPLDRDVDVADSARKVIPYDAVGVIRNGASSKLYVSIAGADESRAKARESAAKPAKTLRIIVVGGAAELAISGLEFIDASLKAAGDRIGLDIAWHAVDEHGMITPAGQYASFGALVKAAADKGVERPDVLDETALLALIDNFEGLLKSRTVDKVFWIKGAYAIPSSIPQRFDQFLSNVSDSSAVPHTPAGKPAKWLQIVSARTVGFSIAYLKEPVNARQVGDVFEEAPAAVSGQRRLIGTEDASVLASSLRSILILSAATRTNSEPQRDQGAPSGKLVLDASDVFYERGYVLSADAVYALQTHLQDVLKVWDGRAIRTDVLADFAGRTDKPRPTMMDLLQMADAKTFPYPRLPKTVPDWSRKPVKDLTPDETDKARAFVTAYAGGVARLVEKIQKPAPSADPNCSLFYVSEESLGVEKR